MSSLLRILGIACLAFLTWFTSSKLVKMAQIRGFIAGPSPQSKTITNKAILDGRHGDSNWVAWDFANIRVPGRNRVNLPRDVWDRLSVGDKIAVYYFPGDRWPYTREDIFASDENFVFDAVLLSMWLLGIVFLLFLQVRHVRHVRRRSDGPPPLPRMPNKRESSSATSTAPN